MSAWTTDEMPDCTGRTVVVTGANSGLGLEATRDFARKGAHVVLACRDVDRGGEAASDVRGDVPGASLTVRDCDLASLDSIREFASTVDEELGAIDVLCNNAGVMAIPRGETAEGFERQFGINHLGHFALTGLLLDSLEAADDPRVITQSSGIHARGEIDFDDLQSEESYNKWDAYAQSKLANVLFAYELDRRHGDDLTSVACHPGYAATNLQYRGPEAEGSRLKKALMGAFNRLFAQSAEQGALPMLYAATIEDIDGGEYVGPGGLFEMRGAPEEQSSSGRSYDEETAARLWELSAELTDVEY
ncbi:oxidoreductase [Natronomonas sp.]|uniref:oxidoreductase n=1 Tax=Natronomonas sp. TaxID=2184060 RepID=UPI002FC29537